MKMTTTKKISLLTLAVALMAASCSDDNGVAGDGDKITGGLNITSTVEGFIGEKTTRANVEGTQFEQRDLIRIKVVCPYSSSTERGESTWGGTSDGYWLQSWNGSAWTSVGADYGFDINGDYKASGASSIIGQQMAQQTPYVFTATTWTEEKSMKYKNSVVLQYANSFYADQSDVAHYKASDVLWAQTCMQTATDAVHFSFRHVMSALHITINGVSLTADAVLTIDNMPDIDQADIVVGDRYASKRKANSTWGYRDKEIINNDADHGKAIGIGVNNTDGKSGNKRFADISQTTTYKALRTDDGSYRMIVPPCKVNNPVIWIRDGEHRWKSEIGETTFADGTLTNLTLTLKQQ